MYKNLILPAAILAGTIIGAGMFALPYLFMKAGLMTGLFYLVLFAIVFILMHCMYADIALRTLGTHRFAGYAGLYLGTSGKAIALVITVVGAILVSTAYLILSISFLHLIIPALQDTYTVLLFWTLSSLTILFGIRRLALAEFLSTYGIAAIVLILFYYGIPGLGRAGAAPLSNLNNFFLPYGAVLFSLSGRVAVTAVIDYFKKSGSNALITNTKFAILLGTIAPAALYALFIIAVLGISPIVTPDAVSGLISHLPLVILWLVGGLGLIAIWSTYIVMIYDVEKSLKFDFGLSSFIAKVFVVIAPLALYFAGLKNFLGIVGFVGGVFIGIEGLLIIFMWKRLPKRRSVLIFKSLNLFTPYILLIIFLFGIILTVIRY